VVVSSFPNVLLVPYFLFVHTLFQSGMDTLESLAADVPTKQGRVRVRARVRGKGKGRG
jgi:hypothetical protein